MLTLQKWRERLLRHLNELLIITLVFFVLFSFRNTEHDIREYIFINSQINIVKKLNGVKKRAAIPVKQFIGDVFFDGDIYLMQGGEVVLIIKQPKESKSGWLFTNLLGGECYKLFGEGNLQHFVAESRKICNS